MEAQANATGSPLTLHSVKAAKKVGRWLSDHFWGAARLDAAGDSVYRTGGKGHLVEDLVVGGSRSEYPVEDDILKPLIDERRHEREQDRESDED